MSGSSMSSCFEMEADSEVLAPALVLASARVGAWAGGRGRGSGLLSPVRAGTTPSSAVLCFLCLWHTWVASSLSLGLFSFY